MLHKRLYNYDMKLFNRFKQNALLLKLLNFINSLLGLKMLKINILYIFLKVKLGRRSRYLKNYERKLLYFSTNDFHSFLSSHQQIENTYHSINTILKTLQYVSKVITYTTIQIVIKY